jgi:deoxyadenosine/deoxycytidine kinase
MLIAIVGNSAVGKTTLVRQLSRTAPFSTGLEEHTQRPFQALFGDDHQRFALANQVDYLLLRAEQEQHLRQGKNPGLLDGGLDLDYHVFTRLFYSRGYLTQTEFELCSRLYAFIRLHLPAPEYIIWLDAPAVVVARRFAYRSRNLEITRLDDLETIEALLHDWLERPISSHLIKVDASPDDPTFARVIPELMQFIIKDLTV